MDFQILFTILVFLSVYIVISLDLINKAYIALLGASLLLVFKIIPAHTAFLKVDLNVISLLLSMMVIVNIIKETGVFQYIAIKSAKLAHGDPLKILILLMFFSAICSAFLDNVTTILFLSPLSILIAVELGISPIPFIITQVIASNMGGTSTLIGDPPNIMIGYGAGLTFNDFLFNLSPLVLIIIVVSILLTVVLFRKSLFVHNDRRARIMEFDETQAITDKPFLIKSLIVLGLVLTGFVLHSILELDPSVIAITGASVLLILSKNEPEKNFTEVEWITIFFFVGLFILVGAMEELGIIDYIGNAMISFSGDNLTASVFTIIWGSAFFSGFIDNIPFVATMIPMIKIMNAHFGPSIGNVLWWSLSAGACLGGNFTLIGASANVVAAGIVSRSGFKLNFLEFAKYGALYTMVSLIATSIYIYLRYLL